LLPFKMKVNEGIDCFTTHLDQIGHVETVVLLSRKDKHGYKIASGRPYEFMMIYVFQLEDELNIAYEVNTMGTRSL